MNSEHTPADHGPEFWSSQCPEPICIAERIRLQSEGRKFQDIICPTCNTHIRVQEGGRWSR